MSIVTSVANKTKTLSPLGALVNDKCSAIGGIYRLDYGSAVVLTDDFRKQEAGGVPLGGFLLAAAGNQTDDGFVLDDEELILLRVRGTASLPNEADLVQTRLAVVRDATTSGRAFDDVTDVLTRNELQQSAFDCEVIGTFYVLGSGNTTIKFGSDIDNVVSSAKYQVFLPSSSVLSWLASYPKTGVHETLSVGTVRFASTMRRARTSGIANAQVKVHVSDFISRKTAVFGMTRTGKSNTIKTLVTAIHRFGSEHNESIGQLIFDPQGEYANVNDQDKTGLKLIGDAEKVRIYRFGADGSDPQIRPLGMNFYDLTNLDAATDFVNSIVMEQYGSYAYVKNFASIKWEEPSTTTPSEYAEWNRARVGFYGLLYLCGFAGQSFEQANDSNSTISIQFTWSKADFDEFEQQHPGVVMPPAGRSNIYRLTSPRAAKDVTLYMAGKGGWDVSSKNAKDEKAFKFIADVIGWGSAKAIIRTLTDFHAPNAHERVERQVWDDMMRGRLAIVDLSYGSGETPRIISENIVRYILNEANQRFRSNSTPVRLQIVVEEAHNLFERGAKDTAANPWLRLSKEAAKYGIGLMYATQEVSSVDQRILSNTSNWLVAHLNSDNETRELSHYYDFKTWAESIRRCEDVGFVRMKTYSGKYIVPVQIAKFDHSMINEARVAAQLPPYFFEEGV